MRKQGLPASANSLCKGVPHWNMGPSEAGRSYGVPSNGHFKCLVQILFRGEGEDEVSGKGKEGRVLDGRALPVFHFLDNSALPQTCKPHSAKQTPCILAIAMQQITPKLTGLKSQNTLITCHGFCGSGIWAWGAVLAQGLPCGCRWALT